MESVKTSRRTTKASSFNVGMPREAASSYEALKFSPKTKLQETGYTHGSGGNSSSHSVVSTSSAGEIQEPSRDTIASADQEHISSSCYSGPSYETQHETGGSIQVSSSGVKMVGRTMESIRTGRRTGDGKSGSLSIVSGSSGSSAGKIQEPPSFISDEDAFASADQQTDILQPLRERFC
ncbi:hypothetical protein Tco_0679885 [Tanacetum coccineum]|uniref:Uncharacterized protein n=1 Tax=Tanacetum coccineum TaxID=301880 RepID=A0ABQ4XJ64_9ASTR